MHIAADGKACKVFLGYGKIPYAVSALDKIKQLLGQ